MAGANHRSAQVLLLLVIPGQLVFLYAIHLMKGGHTLPSALLTVAFLSASLIQVSQTYGQFPFHLHTSSILYNIHHVCLLGLLPAVYSRLYGPLSMVEG